MVGFRARVLALALVLFGLMVALGLVHNANAQSAGSFLDATTSTASIATFTANAAGARYKGGVCQNNTIGNVYWSVTNTTPSQAGAGSFTITPGSTISLANVQSSAPLYFTTTTATAGTITCTLVQ